MQPLIFHLVMLGEHTYFERGRKMDRKHENYLEQLSKFYLFRTFAGLQYGPFKF